MEMLLIIKISIDIKIYKNYKLLINVSSLAKFSSFDFLKDYNFLESGIQNLSKIEKENHIMIIGKLIYQLI